MRLMSYRKTAGLAYNLLKAKITRSHKPVMASIYITSKCNLRCSYCYVVDTKYSQQQLGAHYTFAELKPIIDDFYDLGLRMAFLLGGEPMAHRDFPKIIEYLHHKGIVTHVLTNGMFIHEHVDVLRKYADQICVSLDGVGVANDVMRGFGVYDKAIENIRIAIAAGIKTRIHSVLTKHNLDNFEDLAKVAKDLGIPITISPPNLHVKSQNYSGNNLESGIQITDDEYRSFWRRYRKLKEEGYPIGNTYRAIDQAINWPVGYHDVIRKDTKLPANYDLVRCVESELYTGLSADGTLYKCMAEGVFKGPNVRKIGLKEAWKQRQEGRGDCVSCSFMNTLEYSLAARMKKEAIFHALKFELLGVV